MNILFVDDQSNVLSSILISTNWREKGFSSVFSAPSAARAKEIMQNHSVDILVTDNENHTALIEGIAEIYTLLTFFGHGNT